VYYSPKILRTHPVPEVPKVEDVSLNTDKLQSLGIKTKTIGENISKLI